MSAPTAPAFPIPRSWVPKPSPHHNARPAGVRPRVLVLHADAARTVEGTLAYLADPASKVSYHVVVGRSGTVFAVVPPERRAWHAGVSRHAGVDGCNDYSIGVCLSNENDGREAYPPLQLIAAAQVCRLLMAHFGIAADQVVRHRDVALPAGRKTDPCPPAFDYEAFRAHLTPRMARRP